MDNRSPHAAAAGPPAADMDLPATASPPDGDDSWGALGSTRIVSHTGAAAEEPGPVSEIRRRSGHAALGTLGDYRLVKKIGEGAMGAVYKAYHVDTGRKVAVKVLFRHVAATPKLVERFYREARVAGELDHPNIIRGYEVGEASAGGDPTAPDQPSAGLHYFAMEYVSGHSLQKLVARLGKLSVADALYIILRAARGLQYVHDRGLVHRDVKPDNILVTRKGEVKVGDLGMVKLLDEDMSLTQTGHAVGTPWYMPLEQARNSKDIDGRSDIYALGCVLYALLTGRPPFSGPTLIDVIQLKEAGTFPPARQYNREVPERLDLIVAKMAAKQVKHRYQNCAEVIRDLESLDLAGDELSFLSASRAASPSDRTPLPPEPSRPTGGVWYVRYRTAQGQRVTQKLTEAEVFDLIEGDDFDPTAKASRDPKEGFRALATHREFESVVLGRVTKKGADRQTSRYREMYQKIEAEDQGRRREREQQEEDRERRSAARRTFWLRAGLATGGLAVAYAVLHLLVSIVRGLFG